jgi:hypothetical protein
MTRARTLAASTALIALVLWWWSTRFIDTGKHADLDSLLYFLPTYAATWERLRDGVMPLWNPYHLCGIPWIGTLQGGTFYPLHVLYGFLPLNDAVAVGGVLHLIVAALATAAFVRRLGLGYGPALLAAVVYTLRGRVSTALVAPNFVEAITWLPVGALAIVHLTRRPGPWPVALLAAATAASLLAGYPQPTVYIVYAWGSLLLALLLHERPRLRGIGVRVIGFGGALLVGTAIAAIQLLPAFEMIGVGTRAAGGLDDKTMFPIAPMLTPALPMIGRQSIAGSAFSFGLLALALAPAAALAPARRVLGWWALVLAVLSAAFALGRYLPVFDLYLMLPGMRLFRNPARLLFVTDFAVAIAAALGLAAVTGPPTSGSNARDWRRLAAIVVMALALAGLLELVRRGWAPDGGRLVPAFAIVTIAAMAALLFAPAGRWRAAVGCAVAAAAVVEMSFNPWGGIRLPYRAEDVAVFERYAPELRQLAMLARPQRLWVPLTGIRTDLALKLSTWHRLRTITDYEPVNLQRQSDFFTYFVDGSTTAKRQPWLFTGDIATLEAPKGGTPPATRRRLLDLAAVRWIVFGRGALMAPPIREFITTTQLVKRPFAEDFLLFENPAALPRAFVTYRVSEAPSDPDALLSAMSLPSFDPLVSSFVEGPAPVAIAPDAPARGRPATIVEDGETVVEVEAQLERPGLVVLADSYYPGWRATVDGVDAPIMATNHLFRGVVVPAGAHRVRFSYEPTSVRIGAIISLGGLVVLVCLVVAGRRRKAEPTIAAPSEPQAGAA